MPRDSTTIRVGTFNVENLFARYRFRKSPKPLKKGDTFEINDTAFEKFSKTEKAITAAAIREVNADVLCLQEVENLNVLDFFVSSQLKGRYANPILIDSHDPRRIDVAVLTKFPIRDIRTHRQERTKNGRSYLFSRDCLEIDLEVPGGKRLTLYVNHFKSMMGGRAQTAARRKVQVARVREIVDSHWGGCQFRGNFVVLGDFNDYDDPKTSLGELIDHPALVNVVSFLPDDERWTHFYAKGKEYRQLDFVLLPKPLIDAIGMPNVTIYRKGQPLRADKYTGPRLKGVGKDNPKASDHCPVLVDIPLGALF